MKGNVSGYVCNHGSPSGERDTASPRLCAMLRTQASDEEANYVFSRHPLYCGRAGSDVIGCRRPTSGVFIYVCFRHGSRWRRSPIATPRGCSVSFPTRGTWCSSSWYIMRITMQWNEYMRILSSKYPLFKISRALGWKCHGEQREHVLCSPGDELSYTGTKTVFYTCSYISQYLSVFKHTHIYRDVMITGLTINHDKIPHG